MKRSVWIAVVGVFSYALSALGATSNWIGPGSDFNTAGNWSAGVPNDNAAFNNAAPTTLSLTVDTILNSITFNPGGSAYTLTLPFLNNLNFLGAGIINNSGNTQTIVNSNGHMNFTNSATAGNAIITDNSGSGGYSILFDSNTTAGSATINHSAGILIFTDSASAGNATLMNTGSGVIEFTVSGNPAGPTATAANATIINSASLIFSGNSGLFGAAGTTAGNAMITNNSLLEFLSFASAGNATITNNSGANLFLLGSSTLGNATVINYGTLNSANLVSGSFSVGSISGSGSFQLGTLNMTVGSNNQSTTVSGIISGAGGSLTKVGNGTLTLAGANTYSGATTINAGTLNLLGSLTSDVTVGASGNLSGTGTLQNLVNNGTVTPGSNGTGTLTASGYSGAGTVNEVINGSSYGTIHAIGIANITGGTLNVTGSNFAVGHYSVIHAGSLAGTFSTFNSPTSSLLTFAPDYTPTDALVSINFATAFGPYARNLNESAVATNLNDQKTTSSAEFTNAILNMEQISAAQIPNALSQISGDALASFQEVGLANAANFTDGMHQRGTVVSSGTTGAWAHGIGFIDNMDGDSSIGSPASRATTGGFQAGYDTLLTEGLVAGFSGGYAQTSLDVTDRSSSGNSKAPQYGLYAHYTRDLWFVNGSLAYMAATNSMTRSIAYPGVAEQASSDFDTRLFTTAVETGYTLQPRKALALEPTFSLRQSHMVQDGFTESGAPGLDLTVGDRTVNSWVTSLGLGVRRQFREMAPHPIAVVLHTAWEHEWANTQDLISAHFAETSGGNDFTVEGTPRSRNAGVIGLEGRIPLRANLEAYLNYTARLASAETSQQIFGGARFKW